MKSPKFLLIFLIFLIGFSFWQGVFIPKNSLTPQNIVFSVEKGQNLFQIAKSLEEQGMIKGRIFFDIYVFLKGAQRELKAGKYKLSSSESCAEIAEKIISGKTVKITVTVPEGWTQKQIEEKLNLELPGEDLEGFLFPDTYQFPLGVTGEEVVSKMKENFDEKLTADLREEIKNQGKTISEIITMASLIEKEVRGKEDKELVSGILWKRLEIGMPLQVDAAPDTYKYRGLPEVSICNPGLESIKASIYPKESPYWYYLSAPDGTTYFSQTLEEHNIKRAKYLTK